MSFSVKPAADGPSATPGDQIRDPVVTSGVGTFVSDYDKGAASRSQRAAAVANPVYAPETPLYTSAGRLHVACALLTIASIGTLVGVITSRGAEAGVSAWLKAFAVCYVLYLIEGLALPVCGYTESTLNILLTIETSAPDSIDAEHPLFVRMRANPPRFQMHMECFHIKKTTYTDDEGRTHTHTERVVTHRIAEDKVFASWLDLSGVAPRLADVNARYFGLLVHVEKMAEFAGADTESSFKAQAEAFVREHKAKDEQYNFRQILTVDGYKPIVNIFAKDRMPCFVSPTAYVLATLLLLSWPYRLYVLQHVLKTTFKLRCQVSVRPGVFSDVEDALPARK